MSKKLTQAEFLAKAVAVHGVGRYDYSQAVYVNNATKVKIICPEHGLFEQLAAGHYKGMGCAKCAGEVLLTTEEFIARARNIHSNKYDYSALVYRGSSHKVAIMCTTHGVFTQSPGNHLSGRGCRKCNLLGVPSLTTEQFVEKARHLHGDKYDYSLVEYKKTALKVIIICPQHGRASQTPHAHLKGVGCRECAIDSRRAGVESFIEKARKIHGDKYDYSRVDYITVMRKVLISCNTHGLFNQRPNSHLSGFGCPLCGRDSIVAGMRKDWVERAAGRNVTLYFLKIYSAREAFYKVGITYNSIIERYRAKKALSGYQYEILAQHTSSNAAGVYDWEQSIIASFAHLAYTPKRRFGGATECFSSADEILAIFPL